MNLEKLKKSRATVRQSTTRLINKLESEINKETDMSLDIIEEFLAQLNAKELSLHALDAEIEKSTDIENLDDEINQRENYNENIITWKIRANRILNRQNKSEIQSTTSRSNTTDTETKSASQCTIKLPRLELKKFNGNILKFNEFWEQFDAAIHSNSTLSDVERFNYLKSYLQDEAEIAIRGLSLTSDNYKTAVNILKERYGKKQLIIDAHMHKLLHLTAAKKSNDIAALRRLYAECEIQVRGLQNNGVEPNAYSCLLFPILMNAIPTDLSLEFSRINHKNEETKITELLEFLKKEIECRERNENLKQVAESNELNNKKNVESGKEEKYNVFKNKYQAKPFTEKERNFNRKIPTAATFYTNSSSHFDCIFCKSNNHDSESCPLSVVDRKKKLINQGNCFRCLRNGHRIAECFRKNICSFGRKHNKLICNCLDKSNKSKSRLNTGAETSESTLPFPPPESNAVTEVLTNISQSDEMNNFVYLQTCKCEVINNERIKAIRVMCDLGSTRSFCIRKCADELNLPVIAQEPLKLYSFGNSVAKLENMERVQIKLRNPLNHEQTFCLEAIITDTITRAQIPVPGEEIKNLCKEKGIELSPEFDERSDNKEISVLIGSDYLWEFYSGKVKRFSRNLVAVETRFGYCLSGTQNLFAKDAVSLHIAVQEQSELETDLSEQLNKFWNLESLGIQDRNLEFSKIDAEVMEEFEKNTTYDNLRYEVRLPWNSNAQRLANNFGIAKRRLVNLTKGFKEDYEYFKEYNAIIKDQINKGIAEEVALSPRSEEDPERVYFMPHHGVIRQEKITTKLRIVYDCSSHEKGTYSLNSCLHPGPNLNPNLLTILLSFRKHKVAFISDIEKAFLMVSVSKEDRDCQRFLWFEDPFSENFKVLRMARVTFGVSSSPFLLAATIKLHLRKYKEDLPMAVSILDENLYVDDLISGSEEIKDACLLTKQAKHIMEEASMKLRKWQTNSEELRQYWRRNKFDVSEEENHRSSLKVLGIVWNSEEDTFKLDLSTILKTVENPSYTKRGVLQTTCTIFDPIGFISPFVIRMKILFQKLWERGIKWDDELPLDLRKEWSKWCEEVSQLKSLTIPRTYYPRHLDISNEDTELHVFSDSSESGYGAVAFVRFASEKDFHISFVSSKARVAPLKRLTLPRLELMGAVIAARLASYLQQILEIKKKNLFLWTDSTIALSWIRGHASDWKPFVSNRVVEIQSLTDPCNWNHCSGKENPSDLLTRGCSAEKLLREEKWWNGPKWLMKDKTLWPKFDVKQPSKEKLERERRQNSKQAIQLICPTKSDEPLFDIRNFSDLSKIIRVTAWIMRFVHNTRNKDSKKSKSLSAEELKLAEIYWIKRIQDESFSNEVQTLRKNKGITSTSKIYQFNPFLDNDGILRIGGRLQNANLEFSEAHPIILPSDNYFVELLIMKNHIRVGHSGVAETLTQLRDRFWILKGRQRVKSVIYRCLICRRFKLKAASQDMAPLPPDRINETFPFEVCGVDFAGPLFIKDEKGKAYIALFTCAVTRAVHLETVSDLTTEKFLLAFRRFISRRGICKQIYSDNAKTFKRADKDLKGLFQLIEDQEVLDFFGKQGIQWKYIVERAAWWGGFWERMVRSTKTCLKKIILKASLKFEEIETVLAEVEAILNSRPLTYVYSEEKEPEPLTPGHFLIGRRIISLPHGKPNSTVSTSQTLIRRYKYRTTLVERFWKQWKQQYLLELRSAHEVHRSKCPSTLQKDDVVFINDCYQPRIMWRMGVISEVHPGRDGKVRACTVRLPNGTFLKRPVQLLYPLELSNT